MLMDIRFEHLESLHWLWATAALIAIIWVSVARRRSALLRFADEHLLAHLAPKAGVGRHVLRAILVLLAVVLLVACLVDPRWGKKDVQVTRRGIDIFVALDVSRSMLAEDARPNRLERARQAILDVVDELSGDRIGLITFAGTPTVKCPLTIDYGAFMLTLREASPETVGRGGSNIGDAIRLAGKSFTDELKDYKAVILFTDGEDHGSFPAVAANELFEQRGVRIYTVGLGDADMGSRIPIEKDGSSTYVSYEGEYVWSKLDDQMLKQIATQSKGAYIPAKTANVDMGRMYRELIEPQAKRDFETTRVEQYQVQYQWFAAAALMLLLVESMISDRRTIAAIEQSWSTGS